MITDYAAFHAKLDRGWRRPRFQRSTYMPGISDPWHLHPMVPIYVLGLAAVSHSWPAGSIGIIDQDHQLSEDDHNDYATT